MNTDHRHKRECVSLATPRPTVVIEDRRSQASLAEPRAQGTLWRPWQNIRCLRARVSDCVVYGPRASRDRYSVRARAHTAADPRSRRVSNWAKATSGSRGKNDLNAPYAHRDDDKPSERGPDAGRARSSQGK